MNQLTETLKDIMPFFNHRGVIVERTLSGYNIFGQEVSSIEEVNEIIDRGLNNLDKSIVK